uniref:Sialate O-acetylesterase domain-containing protein n=1 Tax=uncultured Bacillota bacterium TaxID=344338 RepID=A0A650EM79_9FIRM|nr:hypothetical protein Firmicute1046_0130 [uncultured Firmicutes bacterium]
MERILKMKRLQSIVLALLIMLTVFCPFSSAAADAITLSIKPETGLTNYPQGGIAMLEAISSAPVTFYNNDVPIGYGALKEGTTDTYLCYALNLTLGEHRFQAISDNAQSDIVRIEVTGNSTEWTLKKEWDFNDETLFPTGSLPTGEHPSGLLVNWGKGGTIEIASAPTKSEDGTSYPRGEGAAPSGNAIKIKSTSKADTYPEPDSNVKAYCTETAKGIRVEGDVFFDGTPSSSWKKNPELEVFAYQIGESWHTGLRFSTDTSGALKYTVNGTEYNYTDAYGENITTPGKKWHHIVLELDFVNDQATTYLDGERLMQQTNHPLPAGTYETLGAIRVSGRNRGEWWDTLDAIYFDNYRLLQTDEIGVAPSIITTTINGPSENWYTGVTADVEITGTVLDSKGKQIERVELYSNGAFIGTATPANGAFTFAYHAPGGSHTITARAVNEEGASGYGQRKFSVSTIKPSNLFADNMVLQRGKPIRIFGTGSTGETVTARLQSVGTDNNGNKIDAQAKTSVYGTTWELFLPAQAACKDTILTLTSGNGTQLRYENVAIGDVIVCAGQSNMANSVNNMRIDNEADKDYPNIRLFFQDVSGVSTPNAEPANGKWEIGTKANILNFSSTGFVAGKYYYLEQSEEVPVGLLYAAVGGTNIDVWVPGWAYDTDPDLMGNNTNNRFQYFNGMIAPLQKFAVSGVIWYQGESNTWYGISYEKKLTALINSWRTGWEDASLPFAVVQLPNNDYSKIYGATRIGTAIREGQWNVSKHLDNVLTVVTNDTAPSTDVHPRDKKVVGQRIAKALTQLIEPQEDFLWHPEFTNMTVQGGKAVLHFNNPGNGLQLLDKSDYHPGFTYPKYSYPIGFEVRDGDKTEEESPFTLLTSASGIQITSDGTGVEFNTEFTNPEVRYAWRDCTDDFITADSPDVPSSGINGTLSAINLGNSEGYPVAPFRTDSAKYQYIAGIHNSSGGAYNFSPMVANITLNNEPDGVPIIQVQAYDTDGTVTEVTVYENDTELGKATRKADSDLWQLEWQDAVPGPHRLHAVAVDNDGIASTTQSTTVNASPHTATPVDFGVYVTDKNVNLKTSVVYTNDFADYTTEQIPEGETPAMPNGMEITTAGGGASYAGAKPSFVAGASDIPKNMLKLHTDSDGNSVKATVPLREKNLDSSAKVVTIDTTLLFESDTTDGAMTATRNLNITTNDENNTEYTVLTFTNSSIRGVINPEKTYEPMKGLGTKQWYHVKLALNLHKATFSLWVNDILYSKDIALIGGKAPAGTLQNLQSGIQSVSLVHSGAKNGSSSGPANTYADQFTVTAQSYTDRVSVPDPDPEPEPAPLPEHPFITVLNDENKELTSFDDTHTIIAQGVFREKSSALLILAGYNDKGELAHVVLTTQDKATDYMDGWKQISVELPPTQLSGLKEVRAFLLDSANSLVPQCKATLLPHQEASALNE